MKRLLLLFASAILVTGLCSAAPATKAQDKRKPAPAAKQEEKEGTIDGLALKRSSGKWLGMKVAGGSLTLSFYNEKKNPETPDVTRATARWNPVTKSGSMFAVLNPSADGKVLVANKTVAPPYNFKLFLTLLGADGNAIESHTIDFRQ